MRALWGFFQVGLLGFAVAAAAQSSSRTLGVVNGEAVTESEVIQAAGAELEAAADPRERLEVMWKVLNSIIDNKLLTLEAAKSNLTARELVEIEVDTNLSSPRPDEVRAFYEFHETRIGLPYEHAFLALRQFMIEQRRRGWYGELIHRLKELYRVETYLDPLRAEISTAGHPARGPADAPVTIVEFGDFECPYCADLVSTLHAVEENYGDQVRFVFRQYPLNHIHPRAQKAAEASLCANEQGRFWQFHDALFSNPQELEPDMLKQRAADLGLDTAAFDACLDSGRQTGAVERDIGEGFRAGVTGTPTMFINGRILVGSYPYAEIREVIEEELASRDEQ